MIFDVFGLKVRGGVYRTWIVILIQRVSEWAVVCRGAGLLVVGVWIIQIILITMTLLLAIHSPDCDSNTTEQDSATNATDHTANDALG